MSIAVPTYIDGVPDHIKVRYQRDASLRATEIVIIARDRDSADLEGVKLIVKDTGVISYISPRTKLVDGIDII